jgi:hypothetical protein
MDDHEIKTLREEMRHLQAQIDDLKAAQNLDRSEATKAIDNMSVYLWPLVYKVFPGAAETEHQINTVIKPRALLNGDDLLKMRKLDGEDK